MDNTTPPNDNPKPHATADEHLGAVEGDQAGDTAQGNPNATALDEQGLPKDDVAIWEDVLGANTDGTEG
jgi:hypothetical protein